MATKNTVPKLVCAVTGNSRVTTREYIDKKLADLKISQDHYLENYVCKDAMKKLRAGKTVAEIRIEMGSKSIAPISADDIKEFMRLNGKQKGGSAGPAINPREARALAELEKTKAAATPAMNVKPGSTPAPLNAAAPKAAPVAGAAAPKQMATK